MKKSVVDSADNVTQSLNYKKLKAKSITFTRYWRFSSRSHEGASFGMKRLVKKIVNDWFLSIAGLKVVADVSSFRPEQQSYLLDEEMIESRNARISDFLCEYFGSYGLNLDLSLCRNSVERYEQIFRDDRVSDLNGGMGFNNGLILFVLVTFFSPRRIIESGVWRGYTTILLDEASSDDATIHCYDINLDRNEYQSSKARYFEQDISENLEQSYEGFEFAFFDDHVAHFDRISFCLQNKIKVIVVDDDVSFDQAHSDGWPPIPSASMVYNYDKGPHTFSWMFNGEKAEADIRGLDVSEIVRQYQYIPFPSLTKLTGYKDTSFTSVLVKREQQD